MPSLLQMLLREELDKHCCLVVFLINHCKWQVCRPSGLPILVARNCIKFTLPSCPCSVTLIDSFAKFEVHVIHQQNSAMKSLQLFVRRYLMESMQLLLPFGTTVTHLTLLSFVHTPQRIVRKPHSTLQLCLKTASGACVQKMKTCSTN